MNLDDALTHMGLTVESTAKEVRKRYFELSFTAHPDHNGGSSDEFSKLHEAYLIVIQYAQGAHCTHCEGKGHTYTASMRMRCDKCNGTGRREGR
jgi:DnaJ-class molecular chaperone